MGTSFSPSALGNILPSSAWLQGWLISPGKAPTLASVMISLGEPTPRQSDPREDDDSYFDDLNPKTSITINICT